MKRHHTEKQQGKASNVKLGKDSGRVKVFVRVRPPRPHESSRKELIAVNVQELSSQIHVSDPKHSWEKTFNFDHVFPKESTNQEVCSTISRPLVNAALNGFNGTLMAYGQTGSGKTHTLMAPDGITAGVIERCFKKITQDDLHDYKVTMSYLQIYQEKIYDLLNSTNKVELSLREHPVKGVYVENLSEFVVRSPSEVLSLLAVGKKRLIFAETKMNRNSSRSHSVCQLTIERTLNKNKTQTEGNSKPASSQVRDPKEGAAVADEDDRSSENLHEDDMDGNVTEQEGEETEDDSLTKMVAINDDVLIRGRIYLCDLAGSERLKKTQAEGERLSEAQHINSSLLELGNVIQALADGKKTHVPFRNSTLTRLLQESLGGNCKTSLVVCVSPTITDVSETKSALFFGSRAMKITNTAYINVEVDYKRLSEDLSKIVDLKDRNLDELKQSYELRIEKVKHEAESAVKNAMAEADKITASVKSLYESQQSSLESDIENLNSSLEDERARSQILQLEMTRVKSKLEEDIFRAKTTLLIDIITMQLLYSIKDISPDDTPFVSENEVRFKNLNDDFSNAGSTQSKLLENADLLLELFKGYLNMMNSKGVKMLENSGSVQFLLGLVDPFEEPKLRCEPDDLSLYLTNKTDDDKVVASTRCNETPHESHQEVIIPSSGEILYQNGEYSRLRNKLVSLKDSLDGEALDFLKRAFEFDPKNNDQAIGTREEIYERIHDIVQTRESVSDAQNSPELSCLVDTLALLDHCNSHVIVDKALQSALLVLENNNITRRCHDIEKQKNVLEDENETLRKQIQSLKNEAAKLNGKFGETSTMLTVVKKSKEQLEDDLSSVFQLYNMRNSERSEGEEAPRPVRLQAQISSLAEDNEKLRDELALKEQEKDDLKCELTSVKEELRKEKERNVQVRQDDKCVQTESKEKKESANLSHGECSVDFDDFQILHGMLSSFHEDYSFSLEKAASAAQTNSSVDVSSLRAIINKRLGEEWSLLVLENARMKSELDSIRSRINEEKTSFASELTAFQENRNHGKEPYVDERAGLTDKNVFSIDGESDAGSNQQMLEIMVYDQNKVIAKLEMDKLEVVKGLQRYKVDSNKNDEVDGNDERVSVRNNQLTKEDLEAVLKEQFQHISTVQGRNKNLQNELDLLMARYTSLAQSYKNSNESKESLAERLATVEERDRNLCEEIEQMKERCNELIEQLLQRTTENNELKLRLKDFNSKVFEVEQERDAFKQQGETLRQEQVNLEHELVSERELKNVSEKTLREKTEQFEEESRLRQLKENCLSKVEKELEEAKESCNQLVECVKELETERDTMMKEINSLRCLQGLPTIKRAVSKGEVTSKQRSLQHNGVEKRAQNRKNNKLNRELTRAKEQLVRLKAELTLSNMQTRNLGTQLSSLREDSSKLEAELSTVRLSRKNSRSFSYYDETGRLEIELGEAKERIINLQEKLLDVYKEKFVLEEKIQSFECQAKRETQGGVSTPLKEMKDVDMKSEFKNNDKTQGISFDQRKEFENKIHLLEAEKAQLKKDLENTNADKTRLEEIEFYVQQLVTLEDEQLRLKSRLKMWAQNAGDDQYTSEANGDDTASPRKKADSSKTTDIFLQELRALCAENNALQQDADVLKETVAELESDLTTLKLKLSMKDNIQEKTLDKRAAAMLLVSVKQERAELRKALDVVVTEKDELEEELSEIKMKHTRLQREFSMTSMVKDDLELELLSLRKLNLGRGLSDFTKSSEENSGGISVSSNEDLTFDGGVDERDDLQGYSGKMANAVNDEETMKVSSKDKTNERKSLLPRPTDQGSITSTIKKATKRRTLLSEPTVEKMDSSVPRFNTDYDQSETTTTEHHSAATTYNLINIDDVDTDEMRANVNYTDSGLLRETPKGEREKPEGMEQEGNTRDKITTIDKDDKNDILVDDTVKCDEQWNPFQGIAGAESVVVQSAEVLVKTAWSIKNLFRRQKSPPIPDHDLDALKQ